MTDWQFAIPPTQAMQPPDGYGTAGDQPCPACLLTGGRHDLAKHLPPIAEPFVWVSEPSKVCGNCGTPWCPACGNCVCSGEHHPECPRWYP